MNVTIIDGMEGLEGFLAGVVEDFAAFDPVPQLFEESQQLQQLHAGYFQQQAGPAGAWAPLAESTVARKGHDVILIDTDALEDSLTVEGAQGAHREVERFDDATYLFFGTEVEYADYHMTGTARMPARPMVGFTEAFIDQAAGRMADSALEALKQ